MLSLVAEESIPGSGTAKFADMSIAGSRCTVEVSATVSTENDHHQNISKCSSSLQFA